MVQSYVGSAPDDPNKARDDIDQIRLNFQSIASSHAGSSAPSNTPTGAPWWDTNVSPNEWKIRDENGNFITIFKATPVGRDIINNLLTDFSRMSDLWEQEHNRDGSHKTSLSANISQYIDGTFTVNSVSAVDTFTVSGDQTGVFLPNGTKGRMVEIQQPSNTFYSPVENATYDSNNDETTVTLSTKRTADLDTTETIDDLRYGTVAGSVQDGQPLIIQDKLLLGDGNESDSTLRLGAFSLPVDDSPLSFTASDTQTGLEQLDSKIQPLVGYLEPGGLVIANNSTNPDTQIDVGTGGLVWVYDDNGGSGFGTANTGEIIDLPASTGAFDISAASGNPGALINGSTRTADEWYELGIIADSTGSNAPAVVAWTHSSSTDNTPQTSSDLPSGYDYFRPMGTPGKTWWIRTDGSSNILGFTHNSDGDYQFAKDYINSLTGIESNDSITSNDATLDVSAFVPPTQVNAQLNGMRITVNSNGAAFLNVNATPLTSNAFGDLYIEEEVGDGRESGGTGTIYNITGQTIYRRVSEPNNIDDIRIRKIVQFKAVGQ